MSLECFYVNTKIETVKNINNELRSLVVLFVNASRRSDYSLSMSQSTRITHSVIHTESRYGDSDKLSEKSFWGTAVGSITWIGNCFPVDTCRRYLKMSFVNTKVNLFRAPSDNSRSIYTSKYSDYSLLSMSQSTRTTHSVINAESRYDRVTMDSDELSEKSFWVTVQSLTRNPHFWRHFSRCTYVKVTWMFLCQHKGRSGQKTLNNLRSLSVWASRRSDYSLSMSQSTRTTHSVINTESRYDRVTRDSDELSEKSFWVTVQSFTRNPHFWRRFSRCTHVKVTWVFWYQLKGRSGQETLNNLRSLSAIHICLTTVRLLALHEPVHNDNALGHQHGVSVCQSHQGLGPAVWQQNLAVFNVDYFFINEVDVVESLQLFNR